VYSQRRETDVVDSDSESGSVAVLFSDVLVIDVTDQPAGSPVMLFLAIFRCTDTTDATVQSVDDRVPLPIG